jgi:formylglycine-generating enzyme required for sulfatase activity
MKHCRQCQHVLAAEATSCPSCGTATTPDIKINRLEDLTPGGVLAERYEMDREIGAGGMGVVWLAQDRVREEPVALKFLPKGVVHDPVAMVGIKKEANLSLRLTHPNILRLYNLELSPFPFLLMEFVPGRSLQAYLAERMEAMEDGVGRLTVPEVCLFLPGLAEGLDHAHKLGVIHRDIKPANILIVGSLQKPFAKLSDFGIASQLRDTATHLTQQGPQGTPVYMAPEQLRRKRIDKRVDIYALGVTLYQLLSGTLPFVTEFQIHNDPVPECEWLTADQMVVLSKALARDPNERYQTAMELAHDLMQVANEHVPGDPIRNLPQANPAPETHDMGMTRQGPMTGAAPRAAVQDVHPRPVAPQPHAPPPARMVLVPTGVFHMGSTTGAPDEQPVHQVETVPFLMDVHLVTNRQFERFVQATGHVTDAEREGKGWAYDGKRFSFTIKGADWRHPHGPDDSLAGREAWPVVQVSWTDAVAYCKWAGKLLPTEAQWERAARGKLEGKVYPWGDEDPDTRASFGGAAGHIEPVGKFPPNAFGLLDMAGNAWEWCADWYDNNYYKVSPTRDPSGPSSGSAKVLRGGMWYGTANHLRCAYRFRSDPVRRDACYGFRTCLPLAMGPGR